jgi:hypothetical protein
MLLRCVGHGQQITRSTENSCLSQIRLGQRKVHKSESHPSGPSKRSGTSRGDVHDRGPIPLSLDALQDPRHEPRQVREVREICSERSRNCAILIMINCCRVLVTVPVRSPRESGWPRLLRIGARNSDRQAGGGNADRGSGCGKPVKRWATGWPLRMTCMALIPWTCSTDSFDYHPAKSQGKNSRSNPGFGRFVLLIKRIE